MILVWGDCAYAIAAGMHTEASSQGGGTSKNEEGVERVEYDWDERVAGEAIVPARWDEVEE